MSSKSAEFHLSAKLDKLLLSKIRRRAVSKGLRGFDVQQPRELFLSVTASSAEDIIHIAQITSELLDKTVKEDTGDTQSVDTNLLVENKSSKHLKSDAKKEIMSIVKKRGTNLMKTGLGYFWYRGIKVVKDALLIEPYGNLVLPVLEQMAESLIARSNTPTSLSQDPFRWVEIEGLREHEVITCVTEVKGDTFAVGTDAGRMLILDTSKLDEGRITVQHQIEVLNKFDGNKKETQRELGEMRGLIETVVWKIIYLHNDNSYVFSLSAGRSRLVYFESNKWTIKNPDLFPVAVNSGLIPFEVDGCDYLLDATRYNAVSVVQIKDHQATVMLKTCCTKGYNKPAIQLLPSNRLLAGHNNGKMVMWDFNTGEKRELSEQPEHWNKYAFFNTIIPLSPTKIVCDLGGEKGRICIWNLEEDKIESTQNVADAKIEHMLYLGGSLIAVLCEDSSFILWDFQKCCNERSPTVFDKEPLGQQTNKVFEKLKHVDRYGLLEKAINKLNHSDVEHLKWMFHVCRIRPLHYMTRIRNRLVVCNNKRLYFGKLNDSCSAGQHESASTTKGPTPTLATKKTSQPTEDTYVKVLRMKVTPEPNSEANLLPMASNRIIRLAMSMGVPSEHFMRVSFRDEQSLTSSAREQMIRSCMNEGIKHKGQTYEFLSFSNSQLRDQSCWFFAPCKIEQNTITAKLLREQIGRIDTCVVAKYAARQGLAFSTTIDICPVEELEIGYQQDVERNEYNFTDGIGIMSESIAQQVLRKYESKIPRYSSSQQSVAIKPPSAIQIRFAGYKGVLALSLCPMEKKIILRPSMKKFDSDHNILEVIRTSSFGRGFLNRQVITLLSTLGVKDEVFLKLQQDQLNKLSEQSFLLSSCGYTFGPLVALMKHASAIQDCEPYLSKVLNKLVLARTREIRTKARLMVEKSATLLGIIDEHAKLKKGQIFLQPSNGKVVEGKVILFKSPSLHPGDILCLEAVNVPEFRDKYVDVVVFPIDGDRPHFNETSGADLDGDVFTIIWDPPLIPLKFASPMEYPKQSTSKTTLEPELALGKFFITFIQKDILGKIANKWLAIANSNPDKANAAKCIELAKLHSDAVDFAKTGIYVEENFKINVRLEKSPGIIGKMYRKCETPQGEYSAGTKWFAVVRSWSLREIQQKAEFRADARKCKDYYDNELSSLMEAFSYTCELDLITLSPSSFSHDWKHDRQQIMESLSALVEKFRKLFFTDCNGDIKKVVLKALAWYETNNEKELPTSFAWIIGDVICAMKKHQVEQGFAFSEIEKELIAVRTTWE